MDPNSLVTIYSVTDTNQAEVIRCALEAEGINCQIGGEGQAGLTGIMRVDLLVAAKDEDAAKAFLEEHDKQ